MKLPTCSICESKEGRLKDLREALVEIRDVANVSEGVGFYAMLAQKALDKDDSSQ